MPAGKKAKTNPLWTKETNPLTVFQHSLGILLFFYTGKAPSRLFVVLMVIAVKPFDDVVTNHTSRNSD